MALLGATGQPIQCTVTRDVKGRRTDFLAARSAHEFATFPTSRSLGAKLQGEGPRGCEAEGRGLRGVA